MTTYLMYVARYRELFLETKNPIYAWRAFENARRLKYPVPEEVLDYLLNVAHRIVGVAQDPPRPAQRPVALAKALKLHKTGAGQGSAFAEYSRRLQDREIALDTAKRINYYGPDKSDYAFDDISKKHELSKSTVRRNFLAHKERWCAMAKELINSEGIKYGPAGKPEIRTFGTADDMREAAEILEEIERIKAQP